MEENNENSNQLPVHNPPSEQSPNVPSNPVSDKPKFKLPIIIVGIIVFLLLVGATSAFIFLPKSDKNTQKQTEVTIPIQPTTQITIAPSTQISNIPTDWKVYDGKLLSLKFPKEYSTFDEICPNASLEQKKYFQESFQIFPAGDTVNCELLSAPPALTILVPLQSDTTDWDVTKITACDEVLEEEINMDNVMTTLRTVRIDYSEAVEFCNPKGLLLGRAIFEHEGSKYIVSYEQSKLPKKTLDQILSTFKFSN